MLSKLQNHLTGIYRAEIEYDVADFLITDRAVASVLGRGALLANTAETVLLAQDDDCLELSVFLDRHMLSRLKRHDPINNLQAEQLSDLWTVLEGISHFNYIAWSAAQDRTVTLLELEMQAEVDKYVSTWLLARSQRSCDFAHRLHGWLFDEVRFSRELKDDQLERYQTANDFAARFCHGLVRRMRRDRRETMRELRLFYRLSQCEKISHIRSQAYVGSS